MIHTYHQNEISAIDTEFHGEADLFKLTEDKILHIEIKISIIV